MSTANLGWHSVPCNSYTTTSGVDLPMLDRPWGWLWQDLTSKGGETLLPDVIPDTADFDWGNDKSVVSE